MDAQLAEVNLGRLRARLDDWSLRDFAAALEPVNLLAERSPGFVWRLRLAHSPTIPSPPYDDPLLIVNVSVWQSYEALHEFTYRSAHGRYLRQRSAWFSPLEHPSTALWWIRPGDYPDAEEAVRRLSHLRKHGPSPRSFTVRRRFDAAGRPVRRRSSRFDGSAVS